jgi:hypothetical protein
MDSGSSGDSAPGDAPSTDAPTNDTGTPDGAPPRLLLSFNGSSSSELVAFDLQSKAVDGRLEYPGYIGTSYVTPSSPWVLEQQNDVVGLLDGNKPWVLDSSWNVGLNDEGDGGLASSYSDPDGVLVGAGNKAYVLRYTRNLIAVLDTSVTADAGAPIGTIDLSSQLQPAGDGYVEMTAGYYDATSKRLYVLLGNINRNDVGCSGYCLMCSPTSPTIVAIDTTTDKLVPLGSDGGTGWTLSGFDPAFGPGAMVYDATNNRLLVLEAGCNQDLGDGGVGPLVGREIEAVSLTDGSVSQLLDLTAQAYPSGMFYLGPTNVIVQLDTAYTWNPSSTTLGPAIPNAPNAFDIDSQGNLVGINADYLADGGFGGYSVVSVNAQDGGVTTLGTNPFSLSSGFIAGAQLWPPR